MTPSNYFVRCSGIRLLKLIIAVCPVARAVCSLAYKTTRVSVNGHDVLVEQFAPAARSIATVLMLHGAAGVYSRDGDSELPAEENFGEQKIACAGFDVFIVHYFDYSRIKRVSDPEDMKAFAAGWLLVLRETSKYIEAATHRSRIALVGESLGGYLALVLANESDVYGPVALYSTGINPYFPIESLSNLRCPVLLQNGEKDEIVTLNRAKE